MIYRAVWFLAAAALCFLPPTSSNRHRAASAAEPANAENSEPTSQTAELRPNILWISSEDHGQELGCYGDPFATTPQIDALAARGLMYRNVWSNAPVCAPARTTILTGMYPTSLGAEHMRSFVPMPAQPEKYDFFTRLLQQHGYYCTNHTKEDYNVATPDDLWSQSSRQAHYRNRAEGQPFFSVFNSTVSHESQLRNFQGETQHDPATLRVPAYHPDTPEVRRDWAIYYDRISQADAQAGRRLQELADAGLTDSTIVFYWADHGSGMPRHKRRPTSTGLAVPLVIYIPERFADLRPADYQPGGVSQRPVGFVDFAPTVLSLAGIQPPETYQGQAFLGRYAGPPPQYLHGFRGRMDERLDLVRSTTDGRFVYVRNYMPHLPEGQLLTYQLQTTTTRIWLEAFRRGELTPAQSRFWQAPKSPEELFDLANDRDEVNNLAGDPVYAEVLQRFRRAHQEHLLATSDLGFYPEGERIKVADGRSPADALASPDVYPLQQVIAAASLASQIGDSSEAVLQQLNRLADDSHPVLRYWGVLGLTMRGPAVVDRQAEQLAGWLQAESLPLIEVVAASGMLTLDDGPLRQRAIDRLFELAADPEQDLFTAAAAISGLEQLGDEAARYTERIDRLSADRALPHNRYDIYLPRLLDFLRQAAGLSVGD